MQSFHLYLWHSKLWELYDYKNSKKVFDKGNFLILNFLRWYDPLSSLRSTVVRHFCVGEKVANDHHYYKMSCVTNKSQGQSRFYKTGALSNQKRRFLTSKNRCGSMQFIFCRHFFFRLHCGLTTIFRVTPPSSWAFFLALHSRTHVFSLHLKKLTLNSFFCMLCCFRKKEIGCTKNMLSWLLIDIWNEMGC